jgi:hypothetical protein
MEFDFREFCLGLKGLTEEEVSNIILKEIGKLANERNSLNLSESEELLSQDWDTQLRSLYRKTNLHSKKPFKLDVVLKRG